MPDVLSIGLGGGSIVRLGSGSAIATASGSGSDGKTASNVPTKTTIGPDSVGFELTRRARVFGGDVLTATDIAVAAGLADIGDKVCLHASHGIVLE